MSSGRLQVREEECPIAPVFLRTREPRVAIVTVAVR
ncbi:hypothetical protein FHY05_000991 [Sphingomonas sp. BK580]|nr:hypothetical protein [Sphingomonas sp. BK580]